MAIFSDGAEHTTNLRKQAEAIFREKVAQSQEDIMMMSPEETQRLLHEFQVHQIELEMQNEELRRTQVELKAEQALYFDFYNLAPVSYLTLSENGLILEANLTAATLLGVARETLIKQPISRFIPETDQAIFYQYQKLLLETDSPRAYELRMVKNDGTVFWAHLKATTMQNTGGLPQCHLVLSNITRRKLREDGREMMARLITQFNTLADLPNCMSVLTDFLQGWSGCEAVGIRLRDGEDYPYYETRGFPATFVQSENRLCVYGLNGEILRDSSTGKPVLECMCGNILCGRFDSAKPFFTTHGSFWTNSTTALLASTSDTDLQAPTRNRCNSVGYESVALIPLRIDGQVFGLIQFNDRRPDRFSPDLITNFERLANTLALILSRRQTEARLRESEERFRSIVENSTAGYFFIDNEGYFKNVNTAWLILHKYDSPAEVLGRHSSVTQVDSDQSRTNEIIKQLLVGNVLPQGEFTRRCKDNSIAWHTFSINPVWRGGNIVGIEGFLIDITRQKMAEEALRESEDKYRTVADFTYDMETWRGPEGTYRYVSPSCKRITGHTAAEFLANPNLMIEITHPDDRPKVFDHYLKTIYEASNHDLDIEFRILTPSGEIRWISHSCTAVYGRDGHWLGRRESNRNISKRKAAEKEKEKLESKNRQLQKAESLGRMAGAIAHHFNNKLHAVMGSLELVLHGLHQSNKSFNDLTTAMLAANQAAEVSRLMLTYLGQVSSERELLDLSEICGRNMLLAQASMPKNIILTTDFLFPGPAIQANLDQIKLIITNLISNSREAISNNQGSIHLAVKIVSATDISPIHRFPLNWQPEDKLYACLEVLDTGCGIAVNDIDEAFDPFFSTKFTGRGLGLSVVLGLAQAHRGGITVESELGQGSAFRVFLPVSAEDVPRQQDKTGISSELQADGTVLLVDDDEIVLEITSIILEKLGFKVLSARDGVEAVDVFQQNRDEIRFVLTDYAMPRMNGLETLTTLRQIVPHIPVIMASGYSEEEVMNCSHSELPQVFLQKPYSLQKLKDAIQHFLPDTAGLS